MASGPEVARAYATIIPSFEGAEASIAGGLSDIMGSASVSGIGAKGGAGIAESLLGGMKGMLGPLAVAGAAAGVSKALFDIGEEFDGYYDTIKAGTGATGEVLDGLEDSFKNVAGSVRTDLGQVAEDMATWNTRTGATGDALEGVAKALSNLDALGYTTNADQAATSFNAWGVSAEDAADKLDELFVVSQSTGIGMDDLTATLGANAESAQLLGLSFEDTAVMAGELDKVGLDAGSMLSKLSKACINAAEDGESVQDAYQRVTGELQGFINEGNEAAALDLATDLFGTKNAPQFLEAVKSGALSLDNMSASLSGASGAIAANEKNTRSAAESFEILTNKAKVMLEPLGSSVFSACSDALDGIVDVADQLSPTVEDLFGAFMELGQTLGLVSEDGSGTGETFDALAGLLQGGVKSALEVITGVVKGLSDGVKTASDAVDWFFGLFDGSTTLEFPHISLPHIRIDDYGEIPWGIGGFGRAPEIGIDWYAKGGIYDGAELVGVGEAGPEAIIPLAGQAMQPFAQAIASNMGGYGFNVYINDARVNDDDDIRGLFEAFMVELKRKGAM